MTKEIQSVRLNIRCTPFELFQSLPQESGSILLESTMPHHELGRRSIIVTKPKSFLSRKDDTFTKFKDGVSKEIAGNPLEFIRKIIDENQFNYDGDEFCGGLVGYLSYDFGCSFENVRLTKPRSTNLPDMFFGVYDWGLTYNHDTYSWTIAGAGDLHPYITLIKNYLEGTDLRVGNYHPSTTSSLCSDFAQGDAVPDCRQLNEFKQPTHVMLSKVLFDGTESKHVLRKSIVENIPLQKTGLISNFTRAEYLSAVEKAKEYIAEGDIYQVNLTQQFSAAINHSPLDIYSRLRTMNPAPFSAFICVDENSYVLSSSPELFLDVRDKTVETRPIKGTAPRGKDEAEVKKIQQMLLVSEKDAAELVMIVDLERNDLNRVCKVGTVKVPELKMVETYASVHHLVARICGELREDCDIIDLLKSAFPGGSITGAPKIRVMQIINELEPNRRGVYTGIIGYFGFNKTAKLNIAIRTMTYESGRVTIGVGGGIVADSIPEKEYEETLHKGAAMFEALQKATFIEDKSQKKVAFNSGVFETLRAYDSIVFRLSDHILRMNNSLIKLGFQKADEQEITQAIVRLIELNNLQSARVRITVTKNVSDEKEGDQILLIEASEFERTVPDYASVMVCEEKLIHGDELRRHKTTDNLKNNSVYEKAKMLGYDEAIFIDSENHILEGTRSNIFLVKDNVVYTPKLDCGILPGITRQIVLEICAELKIQCVEKILDASELENCDELFLTNSLNEIIPVKKIGDRELPSFKFANMILEAYLRKVTFFTT